MKNKLNTIQIVVMFDTPELAKTLEDAMIARDLPGMADVDSSLLLFCQNVKPEATVTLTGECSDEIFAGYPWYYKEHLISSCNFPWSRSIEIRKNIINSDLISKEYLENYAREMLGWGENGEIWYTKG